MDDVSQCEDRGRQFREQHEAREPYLRYMKHDDELHQLAADDGVTSLLPAPFTNPQFGQPPDATEGGENKYLWLVTEHDVLVILESGEVGRRLTRGRVAHTNLSGGAHAHLGGELWFVNERQLWMNGASSRYRMRSPEELEDAVQWFTACGYSVASFGWDEGTATWFLTKRGDSDWTTPL